jgi:two-component system chemotaxis response regulator CheY
MLRKSSIPHDVEDRPVVLLVDDNAAMRDLIRSLLQELAPVIHECDTGECAVAAYPVLHPDWVLMDIELDGMDGIAATRAIRMLDADATIVIVTGHGGEDYRLAAAAAGAVGFVMKESMLDLPQLLNALPRSSADGDVS